MHIDNIDYQDEIARRRNRDRLPELVVAKILELIAQDDVCSVSCPYDDPDVWRALVAEQVHRATGSGLPLQDAFTLSGPDGGLWTIQVATLGGDVHIPFEGLCGGDLLVRPKWRKFRVPEGTATGRLSTAASVNCCRYVLSPEDFGEVPFATRSMVGDWVLYKSIAPYEPCDVFGEKELAALRRRAANNAQDGES